jgi:sulfonate transport system permease protein
VIGRAARAFNLSGWLVILVVIGLWQLVVGTRLVHFTYLPSPAQVVTAFGNLHDLGSAIGHTLEVTLLASVISVVGGVILGGAIGLVAVVGKYSLASIDVLRSIPVTALMPIALLIWGTSTKTEVIVATYSALWLMLLNTVGGVQAMNPRLHDVAATFQLTRLDVFRKLILPSAMPSILIGARLAIIGALIVAIIGEILVNPEGLGWQLIAAQQALQPAEMWAYVIIIGILGMACNSLLVRAVRGAMPGGLDAAWEAQ